MRQYEVTFKNGKRITVRVADDVDLICQIVEKLEKNQPHFFSAIDRVVAEPLCEGVLRKSILWLRRLWNIAYHRALHRALTG